jgi:hypothetical protein
VVQLHWASRKVARESRAHCYFIPIGLSAEWQEHISVLLIRLLLPLADRRPTAIVPVFVMDRAILDKTEREFLGVFRCFGGEVCSNWLGHVEHH